MEKIDFKNVHDVTGWSKENIDRLLLQNEVPGNYLAFFDCYFQ